MSDLNQALVDIRAIRRQMAEATEFRGYGPLTLFGTAAAALVRSCSLGRVAVKLVIDAAVAEIAYTQKRNTLARQCHTRTTRKKLTALGVELSKLPRCGWGPS